MRYACVLLAISLASAGVAAEADALAISQTIRERHLPHSVIVDPIFASPESQQIAHYTRCGDAAIWTGHYLAAESFRWRVTKAPGAREAILEALQGVRYLLDVTGRDVLARCVFPVESPWAPDFSQEEQHHGVHLGAVDGRPYFWIGNTSRDQYIGVMFGLGVAYEFAGDDPVIREASRWLGERLLNRLLADGWLVRMPGGQVSTTFVQRPDQQLAFLKIGRLLNPSRFERAYQWNAALMSMGVWAPVATEALEPHGSYFKFNLNAATFFHLLRLDGSGFVQGNCRLAYDIFRRAVEDHGNAHFNMVDRAVSGPDAARDGETRRLLEEWLTRPRRDVWVDLRGKYPACKEDNRACQPIPVPERVTTDFLWQRSPFQLSGGGGGVIEGAGIDYLLPYWMGRYYGVVWE